MIFLLRYLTTENNKVSRTGKLTVLVVLFQSDDRIADQKTDFFKVLVVIAGGKTLDAYGVKLLFKKVNSRKVIYFSI